MGQDSNVIQLVAQQLATVCRHITRVRFYALNAATRCNPSLGALGGAGNPQPVTEVTLVLEGIAESDAQYLRHIALHSPAALVWQLVESKGTYRNVLSWEMSRFNTSHLVLTLEGSSTAPPAILLAQIKKSSESSACA